MLSKASDSAHGNEGGKETRRIDYIIGISNMTWPGLMAVSSGFANLTAAGMRTTNVIGQNMRTLEAGMMAAGGAAALALGLMTAEAAKFEKQMKVVQSLIENVNDSPMTINEKMAEMTKTAKELAVEYGTSPIKIAEGLAILGRAGIDASDDMKTVMQAATELSKIEGISTEKAATMTVQMTTLFGGTMQKDAEKYAEILAHAANISTTSAEDIMTAMGHAGGIASTVWDSSSQVAQYENASSIAAMIATLSQQGVSGKMAGTGIKSFLNYMMKDMPKSRKALKELGLTSEDFRDKEGNLLPFDEMLDTLQQKFSEKYSRDDGSIKQAEVYSWFLRWGEPRQAQQYTKMFASMYDPDTGLPTHMYDYYKEKMDEEYKMQEKVATVMSSASEKLNKFISSMQVFAIGVGEKFLPILGAVASVLEAIATTVGVSDIAATATALFLFGLVISGIGSVIKWVMPAFADLAVIMRLLGAGRFKEAMASGASAVVGEQNLQKIKQSQQVATTTAAQAATGSTVVPAGTGKAGPTKVRTTSPYGLGDQAQRIERDQAEKIAKEGVITSTGGVTPIPPTISRATSDAKTAAIKTESQIKKNYDDYLKKIAASNLSRTQSINERIMLENLAFGMGTGVGTWRAPTISKYKTPIGPILGNLDEAIYANSFFMDAVLQKRGMNTLGVPGTALSPIVGGTSQKDMNVLMRTLSKGGFASLHSGGSVAMDAFMSMLMMGTFLPMGGFMGVGAGKPISPLNEMKKVMEEMKKIEEEVPKGKLSEDLKGTRKNTAIAFEEERKIRNYIVDTERKIAMQKTAYDKGAGVAGYGTKFNVDEETLKQYRKGVNYSAVQTLMDKETQALIREEGGLWGSQRATISRDYARSRWLGAEGKLARTGGKVSAAGSKAIDAAMLGAMAIPVGGWVAIGGAIAAAIGGYALWEHGKEAGWFTPNSELEEQRNKKQKQHIAFLNSEYIKAQNREKFLLDLRKKGQATDEEYLRAKQRRQELGFDLANVKEYYENQKEYTKTEKKKVSTLQSVPSMLSQSLMAPPEYPVDSTGYNIEGYTINDIESQRLNARYLSQKEGLRPVMEPLIKESLIRQYGGSLDDPKLRKRALFSTTPYGQRLYSEWLSAADQYEKDLGAFEDGTTTENLGDQLSALWSLTGGLPIGPVPREGSKSKAMTAKKKYMQAANKFINTDPSKLSGKEKEEYEDWYNDLAILDTAEAWDVAWSAGDWGLGFQALTSDLFLAPVLGEERAVEFINKGDRKGIKDKKKEYLRKKGLQDVSKKIEQKNSIVIQEMNVYNPDGTAEQEASNIGNAFSNVQVGGAL